MSEATQPLGKRLQWRVESIAHALLEGLATLLPGSAAFRLGEAIGGLVYPFMNRRKRVILRNLRIAYAGEMDMDQLRELARASFKRTAANLLSAANTARLTPEQLREVFTLENTHLFEHALAKQSGVVILLSHMGNWEVLSRIIHFFPPGTKTGAFYRPLNNPIMDRKVLERRQNDGTRMFSKRDNPLHVARFLREGAAVGILADQRVGGKGEPVTFFGRATRASPLPSLLARRAKSPVLALSVTTTAPGKWKATFLPVDSPPDTANCMRALETAMRSSPTDVFWLQDRWKVFVGPKRSISGWLKDLTSRKPHRFLLWLAGTEPKRPDDEWFHPDLTWDIVLNPGQTPPDWLPEHSVIHRETTPNNRNTLQSILSRIDLSQPLPIDLILTTSPPPKALAKAAGREALRIFRLP